MTDTVAAAPREDDRSITTLEGLLQHGLTSQESALGLVEVVDKFPVRITSEMRRASNANDPNDPISRQFIPTANELRVRNEERGDPIGDGAFTKLKGVVHRYPDRILLLPTQTCQVYCRFCFRREKVGRGGESLRTEELAAALEYIRETTEAWEVIVSGGDPFLIGDRRLQEILESLDAIEHVEVIRFHTRIPVVEPARITEKLLDLLSRRRCAIYIVLHINHPNELTKGAKDACAALADRGIPLLSQSVLLKGVNDSAEVLSALMRALICNRIKPYYLHHLDVAQGTDHFRVSIADGQEIVRTMRGRVSGICQPLYVLDVPGGYGKVPIGPSYISKLGEDEYRIQDYKGGTHGYRDLAHSATP
ncbi:lysine-2,3-aminomutase-like protein [Bradyrhizobium sp. CCBAU 11361]|uniref:lysine-2,3-aminomutase-like protein n=1 Tax=Bradyrhizobium sp. CCBAU 11361 TaxID=1630812 RepID=UPI0023030A4D|nr:lysine-2,3-aminomutase-like protein [Bradyrhizobium sp. CCBAU 11361]